MLMCEKPRWLSGLFAFMDGVLWRMCCSDGARKRGDYPNFAAFRKYTGKICDNAMADLRLEGADIKLY